MPLDDHQSFRWEGVTTALSAFPSRLGVVPLSRGRWIPDHGGFASTTGDHEGQAREGHPSYPKETVSVRIATELSPRSIFMSYDERAAVDGTIRPGGINGDEDEDQRDEQRNNTDALQHSIALTCGVTLLVFRVASHPAIVPDRLAQGLCGTSPVRAAELLAVAPPQRVRTEARLVSAGWLIADLAS